MLFDTFHICYMVISAIVTVLLLLLFKKTCKTDTAKSSVLKLIAILVVIVHYSELWVNYLSSGFTLVESPMLFPIYPCNVMMWLLLLSAFIKKKDTKFYQILTEFVSIAGVVCGVLGIVLNVNYGNSGLDSYSIFSGLFSHSVMVLGCLYLFAVAKVKFRVWCTVSIICGLLFFLVDGAIINTIFHLAGQETPNSMYLLAPPFENIPWFTTPLIGLLAVVLIFTVTVIFEQIALKKEDRWYNKIKNFLSSKKIKTDDSKGE